jgi:enoyl-CoA hydratase/carnithine racemase
VGRFQIVVDHREVPAYAARGAAGRPRRRAGRSERGLGIPIPQAEEIAAGYLEVNEQTDDFHEGPRSFVEKRKPAWKGR